MVALRCRIRKVCRARLSSLVARPPAGQRTLNPRVASVRSAERRIYTNVSRTSELLFTTRRLYTTHMHAHERTLSSLTRTRPRSDGGIRAASRGDDGSSWLAAAAAHVARLRVTRTCQHQQGADESPEGREERGDMGMHALCGRVARVRALTVPPLLPPLQAEDLVLTKAGRHRRSGSALSSAVPSPLTRAAALSLWYSRATLGSALMASRSKPQRWSCDRRRARESAV